MFEVGSKSQRPYSKMLFFQANMDIITQIEQKWYIECGKYFVANWTFYLLTNLLSNNLIIHCCVYKVMN